MNATIETTSPLTPDQTFAQPATEERIERTRQALQANGFTVLVADDGDSARKLIDDLIPNGSSVGEGASLTLDEIGVTEEVEKSGRYDAVRPRTWTMDRATQGDEIRRLGAAPDVQLGSVHALTESGSIVIASNTGSQLGPVLSGAGSVILAAGAQKIVADLPEALRRIERYSYPMEDARARVAYGVPTAVNKLGILNSDRPGRTTVVIIREAIGF